MADDLPSQTAIVSRPAVPPPVRVRQNVGLMKANDPILVKFARAIEIMKARSFTDPTSWRYQAAIHDYTPLNPPGNFEARRLSGDSLNKDPNAKLNESLPSDANTFWRQCQHNGWFFLPWHRMYLHFFEKIVMKIIIDQLDGPADWALPYWNYSLAPTLNTMPRPFISPANTDNQLFVAERFQLANDGAVFLQPTDTSVACVTVEPFVGETGFGGPRVFRHPFGGISGAVENTPHNNIHNILGGTSGFMGGFITAPLDPIFWMHHCNIDRLWEVWALRMRRKGLPGNPTDSNWLTQPFPFHKADGTATTMTSAEVVNTAAAPLSYIYDDTRDASGVP